MKQAHDCLKFRSYHLKLNTFKLDYIIFQTIKAIKTSPLSRSCCTLQHVTLDFAVATILLLRFQNLAWSKTHFWLHRLPMKAANNLKYLRILLRIIGKNMLYSRTKKILKSCIWIASKTCHAFWEDSHSKVTFGASDDENNECDRDLRTT